MKAYEYWMKNLPESENSGIEGLSQAEIDERFGGELEFGTAGMRGIIGLGTSLMNLYTVGRATEGLAGYIIDKGGEERGVAIAYDTRRFSKEFALEAALILSGKGIKAYLFEGVRPVPVLSFAVRYLNASAGIMITASHNPKEYNGYKVYGPDGAQMSPEETAAVAAYIKKSGYFNLKKSENYVEYIGEKIDEAYYKAIEALALSPEYTKKFGKSVKFVYTPLHGAGYIPVKTIFERLGIEAEIVEEQAAYDSEFSTVCAPNPENPDAYRMGIALAKKIGADVVLATDPDSDRLGAAVKKRRGKFRDTERKQDRDTPPRLHNHATERDGQASEKRRDSQILRLHDARRPPRGKRRRDGLHRSDRLQIHRRKNTRVGGERRIYLYLRLRGELRHSPRNPRER